MGTKGNLQFTEQQGGTVPAPRAGARSPESYPSFAECGADLEAYDTDEGTESRAQREALVQARAEVRANSRLIGNLLGSLTAKMAGTCHFFNPDDGSAIAQALNELSVASNGNLYSLKGAKYCLDTYLGELKEFDLVALTSGVLGDTMGCEDALYRIAPRRHDALLRRQATNVLADIAEAVDREVVRRAVHEPLSEVVALLGAHPVDAHKLCAQLLMISDDDMLRLYFKKLSVDELKSLQSVVVLRSSNRAQEALSRMAVHSQNEVLDMGKALTVLESAGRAFDSACADLAEKIMGKKMLKNMELAVDSGNRSSVCKGLYQLSVGMSKVLALFGEMPFYLGREVEMIIEDSMDVLRDHQNNPTGPLNWHSVSKLDDGIRKNLFDAGRVLWPFGLQLDPQLRTE